MCEPEVFPLSEALDTTLRTRMLDLDAKCELDDVVLLVSDVKLESAEVSLARDELDNCEDDCETDVPVSDVEFGLVDEERET